MEHFKWPPRQPQTFGGNVMSQCWSALYWYERLLCEIGVRSILELGTERGSLTLFWGLHCPGRVVTVDVSMQNVTPERWELYGRLGIRAVVDDAWNVGHAIERMASMPRPVFVFCDNGDKTREFRIYARLLQPGDAIGVHDNGSEFMADEPEAQATAEATGLVRWHREELDADGTIAAIWRKP